MTWRSFLVAVAAVGMAILYTFFIIKDDIRVYKVEQLMSDTMKRDHPDWPEVIATWKSIGKPWQRNHKNDWYILDANTGQRQWLSGPLRVTLWE